MLCLLIILVFLPLISSTRCPHQGLFGAKFNKCYKFNKEPLNFLSAETSCKQLGGNLVVLNSFEENAYVAGIVVANFQFDFWIGANYLMEPRWLWTTGTPVNFTNWGADQPRDPSANKCVVANCRKTTWEKVTCDSTVPSVCEYSRDMPTLGSEVQCPDVCSPGYTHFAGTNKCYKAFYPIQSSYDNYSEADAACAHEEGMLAKIPDEETNEFLFKLTAGLTWAWIGLNCPNGTESCFWMDGAPLGSFAPFHVSPDTGATNFFLVAGRKYDDSKLWSYYPLPIYPPGLICEKETNVTSSSLSKMKSSSSPEQHHHD